MKITTCLSVRQKVKDSGIGHVIKLECVVTDSNIVVNEIILSLY
jgi:hypothetical protein